jgi:signal transduction histidine kinase/CheY-like chemotaxis protein
VLRADGSEIATRDLPVRRAARGEAVSAFEERLVFDDGTDVYLLGNAMPLLDREGKPRGSVAAFADVTHLKAVERDLNDLTRTLEARVAAALEEREMALTQLNEAQKTEALGQMAGGVAHDFNNLLSPIIGGLDLLKRRNVGDERAQRLIDSALEAAERARTLVQRMLAFARRQPLQKRAVDLAALLENLHALLGSSVGSRVRIVFDIAADLPMALVDANQLELALLNLALNARDAMPDGGTLTISATRDGRESHLLRLAVADTGIGMDAATLKRAAEPFFSTKGVGKGTGLGLSMVHGLAGQLGGRLELASTLGVGTTVTLLLPVAEADANAQPQKEPAAVSPTIGSVLLVDDDASVREATRNMLEDIGYAVTEAPAAREALALLASNNAFDWIVTDHMMPGMTGADFARNVQQDYPRIRVLIISGFAGVDDVAPDLSRLAKPFRQHELAEALAAR